MSCFVKNEFCITHAYYSFASNKPPATTQIETPPDPNVSVKSMDHLGVAVRAWSRFCLHARNTILLPQTTLLLKIECDPFHWVELRYKLVETKIKAIPSPTIQLHQQHNVLRCDNVHGHRKAEMLKTRLTLCRWSEDRLSQRRHVEDHFYIIRKRRIDYLNVHRDVVKSRYEVVFDLKRLDLVIVIIVEKRDPDFTIAPPTRLCDQLSASQQHDFVRGGFKKYPTDVCGVVAKVTDVSPLGVAQLSCSQRNVQLQVGSRTVGNVPGRQAGRFCPLTAWTLWSLNNACLCSGSEPCPDFNSATGAVCRHATIISRSITRWCYVQLKACMGDRHVRVCRTVRCLGSWGRTTGLIQVT